MFIEKLTKNEVIKFFDNVVYKEWLNDWKEKGLENMFLNMGYDSSNIRNYKQTDKTIKFSINDVSFIITDFDMVNSKTIRFSDNMHNEQWLKYMYAKFGNQYAEEFKKYREIKKEKAVKDYENGFNCQTKKYCKYFNENNLSK